MVGVNGRLCMIRLCPRNQIVITIVEYLTPPNTSLSILGSSRYLYFIKLLLLCSRKILPLAAHSHVVAAIVLRGKKSARASGCRDLATGFLALFLGGFHDWIPLARLFELDFLRSLCSYSLVTIFIECISQWREHPLIVYLHDIWIWIY